MSVTVGVCAGVYAGMDPCLSQCEECAMKYGRAKGKKKPRKEIAVGVLVKPPYERGFVTGLIRWGMVEVLNGGYVKVRFRYGSKVNKTAIYKISEIEDVETVENFEQRQKSIAQEVAAS